MDSYRHAEGTATPRDVTRIIGDTPSETSSPSPSLFEGSEPPLSPESFQLLLKKLVLHPKEFTMDDTRAAFYHLASPSGCSPPQIGAFLSALRLTGKDGEPSIVAACARVMQEHALAVDVGEGMSLDVGAEGGGRGPVCDIVGTGGDGQNTFNVSTTAGIVAAGAGCRVYKHGNKAATSSSGSADILLALGCPVIDLPPSAMRKVCEESPFTFLWAGAYHPALVRMAPIRKQLGFPTVFNALGPLINPAHPKAMIVGVHSAYLGEIFAEALRITGVERAWVVCGREGLDEISIAGETDVWELLNNTITRKVISPSDFGLPCSPLRTVAGGTPLENASTLQLLLENQLGTSNPVENFTVLNAAALLVVEGRARDPRHGVELAREAISSGRAKQALGLFREASRKWSDVEQY